MEFFFKNFLGKKSYERFSISVSSCIILIFDVAYVSNIRAVIAGLG
jgi:hypothetical protein